MAVGAAPARRARAPRTAALALACLVALALVSTALELLRAGRLYAESDGGRHFARYQTRFRELRRLLPRHGVVGYLSDNPEAISKVT